MTIVDSNITLLQWFSKNDTFSLKTDFKNLFLPIENSDIIQKIAVKSLEDFERKEIVTRLDNETWVLNKPLAQYTQSVEIPAPMNLAIAEIINQCCEELEETENICNPLEITARDIANLLIIIENLREK